MCFFVLIANCFGLLPFSYTVTSSLIIISLIATTMFVMFTIVSVSYHGIIFLNLFLPNNIPLLMTPLLVFIEIFSFMAKLLSLIMRLFANLMSGHTLLKVLLGFL